MKYAVDLTDGDGTLALFYQFDNWTDAMDCILAFEEEDRENDCYEPNSYEIRVCEEASE